MPPTLFNYDGSLFRQSSGSPFSAASFLQGFNRGSFRFPGSGGGGGGRGLRRGGLSGETPDDYRTGPEQHRRYSEDLPDNPSQESLTRARHEDYWRAINNLHNKGAGGRLEEGQAAARTSVSENLARAGIDPGSLQGAMLASNTQADVMDQAFSREAELSAQLKRDKAAHRGNLAGMEQNRANALFNQFATQHQLRQQEEQLGLERARYEDARRQADFQEMMQIFSSPFWSRQNG